MSKLCLRCFYLFQAGDDRPNAAKAKQRLSEKKQTSLRTVMLLQADHVWLSFFNEETEQRDA
jgi:hypothetical protein